MNNIELQNATEALETLRMAAEAAAIGIWDLDLISGQLNWSLRCREILGVPADAPLSGGLDGNGRNLLRIDSRADDGCLSCLGECTQMVFMRLRGKIWIIPSPLIRSCCVRCCCGPEASSLDASRVTRTVNVPKSTPATTFIPQLPSLTHRDSLCSTALRRNDNLAVSLLPIKAGLE